MDKQAREAMIAKIAKDIGERLADDGYFKNCYNCEHWIEGPPDNRQQICGMFKKRPPTHIIVSGCPEHSDNIPF